MIPAIPPLMIFGTSLQKGKPNGQLYSETLNINTRSVTNPMYNVYPLELFGGLELLLLLLCLRHFGAATALRVAILEQRNDGVREHTRGPRFPEKVQLKAQCTRLNLAANDTVAAHSYTALRALSELGRKSSRDGSIIISEFLYIHSSLGRIVVHSYTHMYISIYTYEYNRLEKTLCAGRNNQYTSQLGKSFDDTTADV